MPVGGETLAAGAYTATWNSVALGVFEGDGGVPTIEYDMKSEPVDNTSLYAKMRIDDIFQGVDVSVSFTCIEWLAGVRSALWPYSATFGAVGVIARLLFALSAPLVLTAVAGTPAATAGPATITCNKAIIMPGFVPRILFGPTLRKVPFRMVLYPYTSGADIVHQVHA